METTERLLARIHRRIGTRRVTKHYLATLNLSFRSGEGQT
jgi:hypothetical protein